MYICIWRSSNEPDERRFHNAAVNHISYKKSHGNTVDTQCKPSDRWWRSTSSVSADSLIIKTYKLIIDRWSYTRYVCKLGRILKWWSTQRLHQRSTETWQVKSDGVLGQKSSLLHNHSQDASNIHWLLLGQVELAWRGFTSEGEGSVKGHALPSAPFILSLESLFFFLNTYFEY